MSLHFFTKICLDFGSALQYSDSKTKGTGDLIFAIVDPSQFTKDTYSLRFVKLADSTSIGYTLKNITKNSTLIEPTKIVTNTETEQFDGIRLLINNDTRQEIIESKSFWISGNSNFTFNILPDKSAPARNIYQPYDYKITFFNENVYTTPFYKMQINLKVKNITENKDVDYELIDNDKNGVLNAGDDIVLLENAQQTNFKMSWRIQFKNPVSGTLIPPKGNDEFVFVSRKPFNAGDELKFSTLNIPLGIHNINTEIPARFELKQNYPNPFNPSTTIRYRLLQTGHVVLKVYDVIGREVASLVNEFQQPGIYQYSFNALHASMTARQSGYSLLSSGTYFYTLRVGNNISTKKMMLIK